MTAAAARARAAEAQFSTVLEFFSGHMEAAQAGGLVADFTFGNPHEMPLPGLVSALRAAVEPKSVDWFAYKTSEPEPRAVISRALSGELGLPFTPEDIALTQGAFGAIALAFRMCLDPGAEVLIPLPGWFCYGAMLEAANLVPVQVPLAEGSFDLDLAAIEAAITPATGMIVVNTPHNPTGRIYPPAQLEALADLLERKSAENGRRIFILSDEPYRRIRFDGIAFHSPAEFYRYTLIDYSYGKILLAPGLRLGYLAINPNMPAADRAELQRLMTVTQIAQGWGFPDATMQYSVAALETVGIDIDALSRRRARMHDALSQWGYRMTKPEGTFYLWGTAPGGDSLAFAEAMRAHGAAIMPGTLFDRPTDFRICLTATDDMIEAALPAFQACAPA